MAVPFSNTKLRAPRGFRNVLEGLSREILRSQPSDIYAFGSLYFEKLLQVRAESGFDPAEFGAQEEDRFYNSKVYAKDAVMLEGGVDKENAAVKIQTTYRKHKAKKVVKGMREEKAALKIQCAYRGHLDRKYVRCIRQSADVAASEARCEARKEDEEEEEMEGDSPSKIMIADTAEDTVMKRESSRIETVAAESESVSKEQRQEDGKEVTGKILADGEKRAEAAPDSAPKEDDKEVEEKTEDGEEEEEEEGERDIDDLEESAMRIQAGARGMLMRMTLKGQRLTDKEDSEEEEDGEEKELETKDANEENEAEKQE